jgi:hypothetical protein
LTVATLPTAHPLSLHLKLLTEDHSNANPF